MTQEEALLIFTRGVISQASAEDQARIAETAEKLRAIFREAGELGELAFGLVGAEISAGHLPPAP